MRLFLLVTFLIVDVHCFAQKKDFILNGSINIDTGNIQLLLDVPGDYSPDPVVKETFVNHGRFVFKGKIIDPLPYKIRWSNNYISGTFFIESGAQSVVCNTDSFRVIPQIENESTIELLRYQSFFASYFFEAKKMRLAFDSLREIYNGHFPPDILKRKDSLRTRYEDRYLALFKQYLKNNPHSLVSLPELARSLQFGYSPMYHKIYNSSGSLKNTHIGEVLGEKLMAARAINIGMPFPKLNVLDTAQKATLLDMSRGYSKHTLIDFWFSHCAPCLSQFPAYQELYKKYSRQQFEIIGVSVDKEKFLPDWKEIIQKRSLNWPQYLDKNGVLANDLGFQIFPTNFLLDKHGVVVMRNVSVQDLENILTK